LALEHRPDAIILDLMMPRFSGLQLCESFHTLSYTSRIPIFVVSGYGAAQYKEQCGKVGVKAFFKKPVSLDALRQPSPTKFTEGNPNIDRTLEYKCA
jgi:CheY-like chemotaxis protein